MFSFLTNKQTSLSDELLTAMDDGLSGKTASENYKNGEKIILAKEICEAIEIFSELKNPQGIKILGKILKRISE